MRNSARLFGIKDAAVLAGLPVLAALSRLIPPARWPAFTSLAAPVQRLGWGDRPVPRIAAAIGDRDAERSPDDVLVRLAAHDVEAMMWLCRIARSGDWRFRARLRGAAHLDAALAAGSGAVLWVGHFVFASLWSKAALFAHGYRAHHLSHPRHGFSDTRFGIRVLNPIRQRLERRFLASREELNPANPAIALRILRRHLAANAPVSFTARSEAVRPVTAPFLSGSLTLAPGPADLAYAANAPLLPVFTLRAADGAFVTEVQPPLPVDATVPRIEATQAAAAAFAERLEPLVLSAPEQWLGWLHPSLRQDSPHGAEVGAPRRSARQRVPAR